MAPTIATIGVYGWTLERWHAALRCAGITAVVDVRQRRGVRGPEYAWANAQRLQRALADGGIPYQHELELAPTAELRQLQYREDDRLGVGKRSREVLAEAYRERYAAEILDPADLSVIPDGAALLCVERDPEACHRSLVAERVAGERGVRVLDLRP